MRSECIICRKPLLTPSEEHLFPTAMGGARIIQSVCLDCNNRMGKDVDSKLTNHIVTRIFREKYQLAGQSGAVPSFFDQDVLIEGDPNRPAKLQKAESGELALTLIPKTSVTDKVVTITVDAKSIHEVEGIKRKIAERQRKKGRGVSFSESIESTMHSPKIVGKLPNIDLRDYKIGFLKIAYEFACDVLPHYFSDEAAEEISKILFLADLSMAEKFVIHAAFEIEGANFLKVFGDFKEQHTIHLIDNEHGLFCYVTIFDTAFAVVRLSKSKHCDGYQYMLYNNYINRTCWMRKHSEKGFEDI